MSNARTCSTLAAVVAALVCTCGTALATISFTNNTLTYSSPSDRVRRAWPGDVNDDGFVDVVDLLYLVDAFGSATGDPNYDARCDFNNDGYVDVVDLLTLVENFGATGEDTTAPAAVADLAAGIPTTSSLTLTWTAPGDDGTTGTATSYDIRYRTTGPSPTATGPAPSRSLANRPRLPRAPARAW